MVSKAKIVLYYTPNVETSLAVTLSSMLGVKLVNNLGRYLGVPMIHGRVTKSTYSEVLSKIQNKVKFWNPHRFSLAGRLTLCRSVLAAVPIYTMQSTMLPKGTADQIDKLRRKFLWGASGNEKKMSLINWDTVYQSKNRGGLGLRKLCDVNASFFLKHAWGLLSDEGGYWQQILRAKYEIQSSEILASIDRPNCSLLWKHIANAWPIILAGIRWTVGNGETIRFWSDIWLNHNTPLALQSRIPLTDDDLQKKLNLFMDDCGNWNWNILQQTLPQATLDLIQAIPPPDPTLVWSHLLEIVES
ncbi:OLC1v1008013C1 [Oldenlandia corymbosa var. corymbosa]|uniref:OLC1v1008013C1 n=1 Tax=Oldenlandia corymbosa var. corymbosa TaxID=529605 RepID=A0AAV1DL06_OLDCO|nr:OLC1v1008013C1 [Oldenlandia corymbosa var. corymbosa]